MLERSAGGEHGVEHQHWAAREVGRHRVHVGLGLERLLVARHPDEGGLGLGQQADDGAVEPEAGAQHRHHQGGTGDPDAGGGPHGGEDVDRLGRQRAARLVDEHAG